jgi:hypothetical protein
MSVPVRREIRVNPAKHGMAAQGETEHAGTAGQRTTVAAPRPPVAQSQLVAPNPRVVSARNKAAKAQTVEVVEADDPAVRIAPAPNHAKAQSPGMSAHRVQSHDPTRRVAHPANPANRALHVRIAHHAVP